MRKLLKPTNLEEARRTTKNKAGALISCQGFVRPNGGSNWSPNQNFWRELCLDRHGFLGPPLSRRRPWCPSDILCNVVDLDAQTSSLVNCHHGVSRLDPLLWWRRRTWENEREKKREEQKYLWQTRDFREFHQNP